MEQIVTITLSIISLYLIYLGLQSMQKVKTLEDYFLHGGNLKFKSFIGTAVASNLSLGNFIFIAAIWGYSFGLSGIFWMLVSVGAFIPLFKKYTPYFKKYIEDKSNAGSIHEYLAQSYSTSNKDNLSTKIRYIASISTIICLLFALAIEIHLAGTFISALLGIDIKTTFIILTSLICFYTATGGFKAVVATDIIQALILFLSIGAILLVVSNVTLPSLNASTVFDTSIIGILKSPGLIYIASFMLMNAAWFIVTMDTFQRNCATRSLKSTMNGMWWSIAIIAIAIGLYTYIGMFVRLSIVPNFPAESLSNGANPFSDFFLLRDIVAPTMFFSLISTKVIFSIIAIGFVMAGISTADTFLLVSGHSFVTDLLVGVKKRANFSDLSESEKETFTNFGRAIIIFMTIAIIVVWVFLYSLGLFKDPLTLFYFAYSVQFSLLVPIMYSISSKEKNPKAAFNSILTGIITSLIYSVITIVYMKSTSNNFLGISSGELVALNPIFTMLFSFFAFHLTPKYHQ